MATLNPYMGASGVVVNLEGLRRDMRANAFEYLARALDQQPIEAIAGIINGNGQRYLERLLDWYQAERADPQLAQLMAQGLSIDQSTIKNPVALGAPIEAIAEPGAAVPVAPTLDTAQIDTVLLAYDDFAAALLPVAQAEADAAIATYDDVAAVAQATLAAIPLVV